MSFVLACNCTPLYDIMQDSTYLDRVEVSDTNEQLNSLREMILRNNQTGFRFNPSTSLRYFRVILKNPIPIARVDVLTPRSNVQQIRLSYFDDKFQTIKNPQLQDWQINHVSQLSRENNTLDKLCPDVQFRGIRVDLLQANPPLAMINNATLRVWIRNCEGVGGRKRMLILDFNWKDLRVLFFFSSLMFGNEYIKQ